MATMPTDLEVAALRTNVQQLCQVVRGLVQLQSVANQKLDAVIKGNAGQCRLCGTVSRVRVEP